MSPDREPTEADIRGLLAGTYRMQGIDLWLQSPNRNLGGCIPWVLLQGGGRGAREVLAEAERVAGGS